MNLAELFLLAAALGIDCCVVSFSQGLIFETNRVRNSLLLALSMGLFQGIMPCIGYAGADIVYNYVKSFSKWLVFGIFLILGLKFIFEALSKKDKEKICCIGVKCLITMGFATSIDALAAGASLNFTKSGLLIPAILIGIVSFLFSLIGFWTGNLFKKFPPVYLEIAGGIILIGLAFRALYS